MHSAVSVLGLHYLSMSHKRSNVDLLRLLDRGLYLQYFKGQKNILALLPDNTKSMEHSGSVVECLIRD